MNKKAPEAAGNERRPARLVYTLRDAAYVSSLSEDTLRRRAKEGKLRLVKVEGRTLVDAASLRRLLGVEEG